MSYTMLSAGQRRGRGRRALLAIGATSAVVAALALPGAVSAKPLRAENSGLFLVQLAGDPLASYAGGVAGIPATKPPAGSKLDTKAWNYAAYRKHLQKQRSDALTRAGIDESKKVVDYGVTFNGFAAALTPADVQKLTGTPGVVKIFKDREVISQTNNTPRFLGLSGANGVWNQRFAGQSHAGEGQIVGVIDSGFWPESPSFRPLPEPRPDADVIADKWAGTCDVGETQPVSCNNKVIGARWFDRGGDLRVRPGSGEFASPRDRNGHGSHTASTAAGNPADANVAGASVGEVSGVAPAARLAIYKALWHNPATGGASGRTVDIVDAIEAAVSDGVDVINYSIGDGADQISPEDIAFMHAAAAGVFVAASAGNNGPAASTVDNTMPWETTVAAGTHDVMYAKTVTLGNGASYEGVGVGPGVGPAPLVAAANAGLPGADPVQVRQCFSTTGGTNPQPVLDPAKVTGKIVVCDRGGNARVDKSLAVKNAGGVGMVQVNNVPTESLNAEIHSVPTVHLGPTEGAAVRAYAATPGATATLSVFQAKPQRAPGVIGFSSTGPTRASAGDLVKPDILAPGVDVVAAVPPIANATGSFYDLKSGTSMASPHIAGLGALLKQANPTWSPSAVKSALMTTATQVDNQGRPITRVGGGDATPLEMGSGHVRPGSAFDPGLVYESGPLEWLQWVCGVGADLPLGEEGSPLCDAIDGIDPSNLNYPSIGIGDLPGKQTVTRTVTNTTNQASVYVVKVQAPPGITVKVTPSVVTVLPRRSASYTVEFTRTSAPLSSYASGSITLADLRGHSVRTPISVRPIALAVAGEVTGTGTSGSLPITARAGYTGTVTAAPFGLVAPTTQTAHLVGSNTGFVTTNPQAGPSVAKFSVTVPAGSKYAEVATLDRDYPAGTDLDLYVYAAGGTTLLANSGGSSAEEKVALPPGTYDVYLVQFGLAPGVQEQDVKLHTYVVGGATGNFTVTPTRQQVTVGGPLTVTASWSGLAAGQRYVGLVEYGDGSTPTASTVVTVTT